METVKMYHPNIDDGKRIVTVPESAVAEHRISGWRVADEGDVVDAELAQLKAREAELLEQKKASTADSSDDDGGEPTATKKASAKKSTS